MSWLSSTAEMSLFNVKSGFLGMLQLAILHLLDTLRGDWGRNRAF
jgi:hypothetical protein